MCAGVYRYMYVRRCVYAYMSRCIYTDVYIGVVCAGVHEKVFICIGVGYMHRCRYMRMHRHVRYVCVYALSHCMLSSNYLLCL